tara:strand:+ start:789 stop:1745 length:957 start_codon:yes stop_codon:yes gene_type:complete
MSYKKSEKIICFNPDAPTSHYRDEKTREIVHEYKKSITVKDIDTIFLKKRGFIPTNTDSMNLHNEFKHKITFKGQHKVKEIVGSRSNLFGEPHKEESTYCRWCEFLGLNPVHPVSWITNHTSKKTGKKVFPECVNLIIYRNYLRVAEQHKNAFSGRIKEILLKKYLINIGQRVYKKNEILKILIERDGEKCFKSGVTTNLTVEHIKPLNLWWPLIPENTCLLSKKVNSSKRHKWPVEFYVQSKLKRLSKMTGTPLKELQTPSLNHDFLDWADENWNVIEQIIDNRKELKQVGGKDKFKKTIIKDIEDSKRARNTIDNI